MNQGDQFYRYKPISGIIQVVEVISSDPEYEYLIHVKNVETNEQTFINRKFLDKWKPVAKGVQTEMFIQDLRLRYQKHFARNFKKQ